MYDIILVDESPKLSGQKMVITSGEECILSNVEKTLIIEKDRTKFVVSSLKKFFIYDRSIYSFVAIGYAYYNNGMTDYFCNYIDNIIEGINNEKYLIPDYLIYLNIDKVELLRRKSGKKKHISEYWISVDFNNNINFILKKIVIFYENINRLIDFSIESIVECGNDNKISKEEVVSI